MFDYFLNDSRLNMFRIDLRCLSDLTKSELIEKKKREEGNKILKYRKNQFIIN